MQKLIQKSKKILEPNFPFAKFVGKQTGDLTSVPVQMSTNPLVSVTVLSETKYSERQFIVPNSSNIYYLVASNLNK